MAFWSDLKLKENLKKVISPANINQVDVSGYRLSVGNKAFVTQDVEKLKNDKSAISLYTGDRFEIPSGQFALISTKERVTIPINAIGLISMRASTKFKGLINVSGFHVDPGYSGHLIYAVFNAGPKPISISKGDEIFLIWFVDLDRDNSRGKGDGLKHTIPSDMINNLNIQVDSTAALSEKLKNLQSTILKTIYFGGILASIVAGGIVFVMTWAGNSIFELQAKSLHFENFSKNNDHDKRINDINFRLQEIENKVLNDDR